MHKFIKIKVFSEDACVFIARDGLFELIPENEKVKIQIVSQFDPPDFTYGPRILINRSTKFLRITDRKTIFFDFDGAILVKLATSDEMREFLAALSPMIKIASSFDLRTDASSAVTYFQFYSYLSQQQNMLSDRVRTETYNYAILRNSTDFRGKIIMDVGTGSGILAFFAIQAGAKHVYAVEASNMAGFAKTLVENNNLSDRITVISKRLEDITDMPQVDVIISESMGYMLFNERMIETFLYAKRWLVDSGTIFPTVADFYVVPFTDEAIFQEIYNKAFFWYQKSFYGVDFSSLFESAVSEYFSQPVVDTFDSRIFMSPPSYSRFDFRTLSHVDLESFPIDMKFEIAYTGILHGICTWFTVSFYGSEHLVTLSTAPDRPLTHWYQMRFVFSRPLYVQSGQTVRCVINMIGNRRMTYDVTVSAEVVDEPSARTSNSYDLKNCFLRCMNQNIYSPSNIIREPINKDVNDSPEVENSPSLQN